MHFVDLKAEANTRATLKAAVERHITRDVVVILDSMNYIKGYRYELFCISRAAATTRVTVSILAFPNYSAGCLLT